MHSSTRKPLTQSVHVRDQLRRLRGQQRVQEAGLAGTDGGDQGEAGRHQAGSFIVIIIIIIVIVIVIIIIIATLLLLQAAKITKECQTNRVKDGQDAEFVCGFAGNPRPEVNWFFKGEKLEEGENCKIKVRD